jgi:predicted secreted protein
MAFVHGKSAVFKLDNSSGTIVDLSSYLMEISFPESIDTADVTAFSPAGGAKAYIVGLKDAKISLTGKWDATFDAHIAAILGQTASVSFEYGPAGSTSTFIKYTGESFVTSYNIGSPVGDVVSASVELQVTGAVTRTTW